MLAGREGGSSLSPFASDMLRLQSLIRYAPYVVKLVFHSDPLIEINIKLDIIRERRSRGGQKPKRGARAGTGITVSRFGNLQLAKKLD